MAVEVIRMLACGMSGWDMGWGWWLIGGVFMVGIWGALIGGAISLVHHRTGGRSHAEEELSRRFAAGEIGEDEYRARLAALRDAERGSHA